MLPLMTQPFGDFVGSRKLLLRSTSFGICSGLKLFQIAFGGGGFYILDRDDEATIGRIGRNSHWSNEERS